MAGKEFRMETCPWCEGRKVNHEGHRCARCNGSGLYLVEVKPEFKFDYRGPRKK